ncbi:MAG: GNAT family N-acetyltransferase [Candidatus Aenigmarchaeota archaeon]|nr:GNAT family N-acetyltransferase [Candidatus Aenigmarchaeota archaeon]
MQVQESIKKKMNTRQLDILWASIGWRRRGSKKWREVLSKSRHVYSLWDGKQLVGFGRIVEDGIMCMFYDIAVHPERQGTGLGKMIMDNLINQVKGKKYASIGLFAWDKNPNNIPFYGKFGFEKSAGMELKRHMKPE